MAKPKTERITDIQEQIKQLENQKKKLIQERKQQEREDRTYHRCQRMGVIESMLDQRHRQGVAVWPRGPRETRFVG